MMFTSAVETLGWSGGGIVQQIASPNASLDTRNTDAEHGRAHCHWAQH